MRARTSAPPPAALVPRTAALLVLGAVLLTGCSASGAQDGDDADAPVVLAAASAEPALERIAQDAAADDAAPDSVAAMAPEHAGTSTLVSQIESGRSFDVVLSASRRHMTRLQEGGHIGGDPLPVAANRLVLAVPAGNPGGIEDFADFADRAGELTTAICAAEVPCGMLAETLALELELDLHADTEETSAASVLTKVIQGEVDAGLVYRTDAEAAGEDVQSFEVPEVAGGTNQLWAGVSADPPHPEAAEALMDRLASPSGRAAFEQTGFLPPPTTESEDGGTPSDGARSGD